MALPAVIEGRTGRSRSTRRAAAICSIESEHTAAGCVATVHLPPPAAHTQASANVVQTCLAEIMMYLATLWIGGVAHAANGRAISSHPIRRARLA